MTGRERGKELVEEPVGGEGAKRGELRRRGRTGRTEEAGGVGAGGGSGIEMDVVIGWGERG